LRQKRLRELLGRPFTGTGYRNGVPYKVKLVKVDGKPTGIPTAKAYLKMQAAAKRAGIHLQVVSGFRTYAHQAHLYRTMPPGYAARPGYSNHQNGIALDLNTGSFSSATYNWLTRNAHRFGFERTVPHEHWHWEYRR
ncbi:MAG: D-alanyl-D-alanine carboxypeptidase family protein, partial [Myxococcales bacterium]